jgi:hypothetical protein
VRFGSTGFGQRRSEAGRALLQECDVPLGSSEHRGKLAAQFPVDLKVRGVALGYSQQA